MIQEKVTIINKLGLHARAAAKFVATSGRFASSVKLVKGSQEIDGKSIMAVMMLAASKGTELELMVDGSDEQQACTALRELIEDYFGEGE